MTKNQTRALMLARALTDGRLRVERIDDEDWMLLLLAAGLRQADASPEAGARRVLETARAHIGYFWPGDGARRHRVTRVKRPRAGAAPARSFAEPAADDASWMPRTAESATPSFAA